MLVQMHMYFYKKWNDELKVLEKLNTEKLYLIEDKNEKE